jgi:hypothetical protein
MRHTIRTILPVLCAVASLLVASLVFVGTASASSRQSASGEVRSDDGSLIATFRITRDAGGAPTDVEGRVYGRTHPGLIKVRGPAICLDVRRHLIGMAFRFEKSSPGLLAETGTAEMISLTLNDDGDATALNFVELPAAAVRSCRPVPGGIPASGHVHRTF